MFCTMVLYHYPAGCEHPLVKVREHVWLQIREHLVVMPCAVCPIKMTGQLLGHDRSQGDWTANCP
jgi:hypothetical protein